MATKIKVKKITDLTLLPAEDTEDVFGNNIPGAQDIDQIIVAHNTNVNDEGGADTSVVHTNAMELGELLTYVHNGLKSKYMSAEDGEELRELIEQRLREAEENMAKGNDTYSSNYFVDDSGNCRFDAKSNTAQWDKVNDVDERYTSEFTFKSTGAANCHLTIYRGTDNTAGAIAAQASQPKVQMYAKIQVKSRSGVWKAICQQPVQSAHGAFDIELHGYFYAGTVIRGIITTPHGSTTMTDKAANINTSLSYLQVTRFSSDKGFPEHSFDWWVSNNSARKSSTVPPQTISSDGFLNFSGLYWHNKAGKVGTAKTDYFNKKWINYYCTDAVYAKIFQDGKEYFLGNTENDRMAQAKAGVTDDFSGKYYYISATASYPVSAFTTTDFLFTDDTKKNYADSGGGWHNATLIKYVDHDELSTVAAIDNFSDENPLYRLSELKNQFGSGNAYHRFKYEGGLGMYLSSVATNPGKIPNYMGTNMRNTARLELKSYSETPGCYLREQMGSNTPNSERENYSFVPTYTDGQTMHTIIRDYAWTVSNPTAKPTRPKPIGYTLDILNKNIEQIGVGPDVYKITAPLGKNTAIVKGDKNDTYDKVVKYLDSDVSAGWALSTVSLVSSENDITIRDFGFAACPRLSSFEFPKGVGFTGRYTFAAPSKLLTEISCTDSKAVESKANIPQSQLSGVKFCDLEGSFTHVDGLDGNGQTWATFANCVNLKYADIQHTDAQALGNDTFRGCAKLLSVELPDTCKTLGNSVFLNCKNLSCVVLPSSIGKFGTKVFTGCPQLTSANAYNKTKFNYVLGTNYNITIKLSGVASSYESGGTVNKTKIWKEIQGLVKCLQTEKMGSTAASTTSTSRKGRRFYIYASDQSTIGGQQLVFNTIYTSAKVGVFSSENIVAINAEPQC